MIYGYARCSTNETKQDINRQVRELKAAGAEKIFLEYEHGDAVHKKEQMLLFDTVKEGDTISLGNRNYLLRRAELYYYGNEPVYQWGLCVEKGVNDTWGTRS